VNRETNLTIDKLPIMEKVVEKFKNIGLTFITLDLLTIFFNP
jgi:hypothetical protein